MAQANINEALLESIEKLLDDKFKVYVKPLQDKIDIMDNSITYLLDEIKKVDVLDEKYEELKSDMKTLKEENVLLKVRNKELEDLSVRSDSFIRKNNLKFLGIKENKSENIEAIIIDVLKRQGINHESNDISQAYRIGPFHKGSNRPILVRFQNFKKKMSIVSKKADLKKDQGIVVLDDFSDIVRERRKLIVPTFFRALQLYPNLNPKLLGDKFLLDKKIYTCDDLENIDKRELRPENVFTRRKNNVVAYYTKYSPFSNHNTTYPFTIDQHVYPTVENFFMYRKAQHFRDYNLATEILKEQDPVANKRQGNRVNNFDLKEWKSVASDVMYEAMYAKFSQNVSLKETLLSTEKHTLAEASPTDLIFGTGIPIRLDNAFDTTKFKGENLAGKTLEKVRKALE